MTHSLRALTVLVLLSGITGCATLDYKSPESVNLSGTWVVDPALSQHVLFAARNSSGKQSKSGRAGQGKGPKGGERGGRGHRNGGRGDQQQSDNSPAARISTATIANAREIIIDHVNDSMGIMYENGKYRDIDWGETEQRRQKITAGWQDDELVIKSTGGRVSYTESYTLEESGTILTMKFNVDGKEYVRVYKRKADEPKQSSVGLSQSSLLRSSR